MKKINKHFKSLDKMTKNSFADANTYENFVRECDEMKRAMSGEYEITTDRLELLADHVKALSEDKKSYSEEQRDCYCDVEWRLRAAVRQMKEE
jgi:hypothetical protein